MTREETGDFLDELQALYPNVVRQDSNLDLMLNLWEEALKEFSYEDIHKALQDYFRSDRKGYVPTAGQLIELTLPEADPLMPKDHEYWGEE